MFEQELEWSEFEQLQGATAAVQTIPQLYDQILKAKSSRVWTKWLVSKLSWVTGSDVMYRRKCQ